MSEARNWIAGVAASVIALVLTTSAMAQTLAAACSTFSRSSPMMKDIPGDKSKWCGCIASNITPAEHDNAAFVMNAQTEIEIGGGLFNLDTVPASRKAAATQYFDALGVCLPILLGGAPGGAPVASAAAPSANDPSCPAAAAPAAGKVEGIAAWALLVGNTAASKVDGKDHADFYTENGTVQAMRDRDLVTGKWSYEAGKACVAYPKEDKKCYSVTVDGELVSFSDKPGRGIRMTLLKGNPRKL